MFKALRLYPAMLIWGLTIFILPQISAETKSTAPPLFQLPSSESLSTFRPASADTVKIFAILVEFQNDDLPTTSGDGSFNSTILEDDYEYDVDPLPHSKEYFQDQLLFLKNFFETVSGGKLVLEIQSAVHPDTGAYLLPHPMWHYNHNTEAYLDTGLASLFYDAWMSADSSDPSLDFSQYDPQADCFIVFHAGVGKDFAFDYDPSPFDIPSAYLELVDLTANLPGLDPQGIPVQNGTFHIQRGMILPETENQMGYNLGMHGHMTILFGHHIGIPDLYNTETGETALGLFGMMDQGSGKLDGLVPAPPDAWTKTFMGWTETETITSLPADISAPLCKVFKIPISQNEYFLLENTESNVYDGVSYDSLRYLHYQQTGEFADAYTMLTQYIADSVQVTWSPRGVLVNIEDWGIGRPASGILIWHIDQNVIDANIASDRINADPDHRGVDLEEADGAQDLGQTYGFFSPGYGTELGTPYDAFFADNPQFLDANPLLNEVTFSDYTFPSAKSNCNTFTHLKMNSFSPISDTMTFSLNNDLILPGFPVALPSAREIFNANIDGVTGDEILATTESEVFAYDLSGVAIFNYNLGEQILCPPAVSDFDHDETDEIAVLTADQLSILDYDPVNFIIMENSCSHLPVSLNDSNNFLISADSLVFARIDDQPDMIYCWRITDNIPALKWEREDIWSLFSFCLLPAGRLVGISPAGGMVCIGADSYAVWDINLNSSSNFSFAPSLVAGDLDRDQAIEVIAVANNSLIWSLFAVDGNTGALEAGFPSVFNYQHNSASPLALSLVDIDRDGFLEIIVNTGCDGIGIIERNGVISDYSPLTFDNPFIGGSPLIGMGNSQIGLCFYGGQNDSTFDSFYACDRCGSLYSGFPFILPAISPLKINYARLIILNDSQIVLSTVIQDQVYAWSTDFDSVFWGSAGGDKSNSARIDTLYPPLPQTGTLMPPDRVYNWPNPNLPGENVTHIRYYLNYNASIKIKIYDFAGDLVDELYDTGLAQAENETDWNLTGIASGVYFARVEASGAENKSVAFIKIAVIK